MKKTLLAIAISAATVGTSAYAADDKNVYVELGVGKASVDVSTKTYSGSVAGITFTNAKANYEYEDATTYGLEIGVSKFLGTPFRVGFGVATLDLKFERATGTGTIGTGLGNVTLSVSGTAEDFRNIGLVFPNRRVKMYMANGYYDFPTSGNLKPFVGAGLGLADVESAQDQEFAFSLHAGLNYELGNNMYVGGRFSHYRVAGITDNLGVKYEPLGVNYFGMTLGVRF